MSRHSKTQKAVSSSEKTSFIFFFVQSNVVLLAAIRTLRYALFFMRNHRDYFQQRFEMIIARETKLVHDTLCIFVSTDVMLVDPLYIADYEIRSCESEMMRC